MQAVQTHEEKESIMKPTLGRIVHFCRDFHAVGGTVRAAIISNVTEKPPLDTTKEKYTEENAFTVDLHVLTPWGVDVEKNVSFNDDYALSKENKARTWFWPPRD